MSASEVKPEARSELLDAIGIFTRVARSSDLAEFVTLALAGAAANVGGIDAALSRPGSWEAAGVQQLLTSTVGDDERELWRHRTDPVRITLYVDALLTERFAATGFGPAEYDQARDEIYRRVDAAAAADPEIDPTPYTWKYVQAEAGEWQPTDPQAPAWSWVAWRTQMATAGASEDVIETLLETSSTVYLNRSTEAGAELSRLDAEREVRLAAITDLEEQLEEQRDREWTAYGNALKTHIEADARARGLVAPLEVVIDLRTFPAPAADWWTLEARLVDEAVMATPAELPGTPLDRLLSTRHDGTPS